MSATVKYADVEQRKRKQKKLTAKVGQSALLLIRVAGTSDSAKSSSRSIT